MTSTEVHEWKVQFALPDVRMTDIARYLSGAWMSAGGMPGSPDQIGSLLEGITRYTYGGMPLSGRLALDDTSLIFEPQQFLQNLVFDDLPQVKIPRAEIRRVYVPRSFIGLTADLKYPAVVLETIDGEFRLTSRTFLLTNKGLSRKLNSLLNL